MCSGLHSRMIAIAINIMSTWWNPRNGINPRMLSVFVLFQAPTCYSRCMLTANRRFAIVSVCLRLCSDWNGWVFGSLRPQRAGRKVRRNALRLGLAVVSHSKNGCDSERLARSRRWLRNVRVRCLVGSSCSFGRNVILRRMMVRCLLRGRIASGGED